MMNFNQLVLVCNFCEGYGRVNVITDTGRYHVMVKTVERCPKKCINGFFK